MILLKFLLTYLWIGLFCSIIVGAPIFYILYRAGKNAAEDFNRSTGNKFSTVGFVLYFLKMFMLFWPLLLYSLWRDRSNEKW